MRASRRAGSDNPGAEVVRLSATGDVRALITTLQDIEAARDARFWAAWGLGEHKLPQTLPVLVRAATSDPDQRVRVIAIKSLGRFGEEATVPLLELTHWDDSAIRITALDVLSRRRADEAFEPLLEYLSSEDASERQWAEKALRRFRRRRNPLLAAVTAVRERRERRGN